MTHKLGLSCLSNLKDLPNFLVFLSDLKISEQIFLEVCNTCSENYKIWHKTWVSCFPSELTKIHPPNFWVQMLQKKMHGGRKKCYPTIWPKFAIFGLFVLQMWAMIHGTLQQLLYCLLRLFFWNSSKISRWFCILENWVSNAYPKTFGFSQILCSSVLIYGTSV